ncbi:hypothetical protein, partial [Escherichia coli]
ILISESAWEEMTCLFAPSLGVYCVGVYYWNIGVYVLIYINNPSRINTQHSGQMRFDISLC